MGGGYRLFLCVWPKGRGKRWREDDKRRRQNRMVQLMEMGYDSSPWDCVINWDQVTSSVSGQ